MPGKSYLQHLIIPDKGEGISAVSLPGSAEVNKVLMFTCRSRDMRPQDVTESLLELRERLNMQVTSSQETTKRLVSSSTRITTTKTGMDEIGADLKGSGRLISKYERRELTDKVLIALALVLLFGVVLYIIQKRTLGWLW